MTERLVIWVVETLPLRVIGWACVLLMLLSGADVLAAQGDPVAHDRIAISLPVYVTSLGGVALFAFTLGRYDANRAREIDAMKREVENLKRKLEQ